MAAAAKCKHISYDNLSGNTCRLTGASVGSDCGGAADRLLDDATDCIPRQALRYVRGDRESFATLGRLEREAVMGTAAAIRERIAAGMIRHEDTKETAEVTDDMTDLSSMTSEQLRELAGRAKAAAREREKANKQASAARPALEEERARCMGRVLAMNKALEALEAGRTVDLRELGLRVRRGTKSARGPRAAGQGPKWTPEQRLAQAERVLEVSAKRYGWSPKRLAEAKAKARKKAGL